MLSLRQATGQVLGNKFEALHIHDFILSQGLLSPSLKREAVMAVFIPADQKSRLLKRCNYF